MFNSKKIYVVLKKAGIGDILTLTPGLKEFRKNVGKKYKIHVFVPSEDARQVLLHNSDINSVVVGLPNQKETVTTLDITNYPAEYESKVVPRIKKSRIELYNEALGNSDLKEKSLILNLTSSEIRWGQRFCTSHSKDLLIGIQLCSKEVYKDWPLKNFEALCTLITKKIPASKIFCFGKAKDIKHLPDTFPVVAGLRRQAAIVRLCDLLITPDSLLLHLGSRFQIPTLLILGPSGWRAKYSNVEVCQRKDMSCCPCWMNASMKCNPKRGMQRRSEGGFKTSGCLEDLNPIHVFNRFEALLETLREVKLCDRLKEE